MAENEDRRKLTAILCADVKGYSKLMGENESYTVGALKECRKLFAQNIHNRGGRVVNAPGDSILAEFPSVVTAVKCAVEIQNQLNARNAELPDNRRMAFRIGINLGDVIESEDVIYGDGVNIAARIETLADSGGVSISRTVFNHVQKKLPYGYEYQGEHQVKNITNPVRVYKLLTAPENAGKLVGMEPPVSASKWIWPTVVVAAIVVTLICYQLYQKIAGPTFEPASVEKMAYELPVKPSIAVLPFDNMSGDPEQEYICEGLSEQIITSLCKVSGLFVIARNSSFTFKGKAVKVQEVAEQLGVQYILEGSLQKSGDKVRITAQLINAITGRHLWAETYHLELQDIFTLQDEITIKILGSVGAELTKGERERVYAKGTNNLEAYIKVSKGSEHFERQGKEENLLARKFAKEAIDLDPYYPSAWNLLGGTYLMDPWVGSTDSANPWDEAIKAFQKALKLDENFAPSHGGLAMIYGFQRKYEKALAQAQKGIALNPGFPIMHLGYVLVFVGRYEEAVHYFKKAIRHDPKAPTFYYNGLGHAYRGLQQYEDAIASYKRALEREPDYLIGHIFLTSAYYLAGREGEARAEVAEVLRLQPEYSVARLANVLPYQDKNFYNRTLESLLRAGLPENPPLPIPDKPSIAVLPFDNLSGDSEQEYFSDGITEDIITALSKTPKMLAIARNSTFTYKGKPVKVQQVAKDLGVRYVLEGSVQKTGERVRITAKLVDAKSGHHLWAEKYDRDLKNIFALQDEITKEIITALQVNLTEGEQATIYGKGTDNLEAYLKVMEGNWRFSQLSKDGVLKARQLAEESIALDPNYASAYQLLGRTYGVAPQIGISKNPRESWRHAIELIRRAIEINGSLAIAHASLGGYLSYVRQYDSAIAEGKRALELGPNSADVVNSYAAITALTGNPEKAIPYFKEAIRLNPKPPSNYFHLYAIALRDSGKYQEAIIQARKAVKKEPDNLVAWVVLTSSLGLNRQIEESRVAGKEILRLRPNFSVADYERVCPQKDRNAVKRFCDALRRAGLPE